MWPRVSVVLVVFWLSRFGVLLRTEGRSEREREGARDGVLFEAD